jgi:hypothetical protein
MAFWLIGRLGRKLGRFQGQDAGVVAADVEHLVALYVQVAVEGFGKHLIGGYQGVERPGA